MGKENPQQPEILESFQAKTDDRSSPKIHDKSIWAKKADNEINIWLFFGSNDSSAFLVSFSNDFLWRRDRNEVFKPRVVRHSNGFHSLLEDSKIDEREKGKVIFEKLPVGLVIKGRINWPLFGLGGNFLQKSEKVTVERENFH